MRYSINLLPSESHKDELPLSLTQVILLSTKARVKDQRNETQSYTAKQYGRSD